MRSSSKALKVDDSSNDEFEEELDEYELAFISRKIHKMWRKRVGPSGETSQEECPVKKKDRDKSSIVFYECKKPGHFKFECPNLEKSQDKKKYFKT